MSTYIVPHIITVLLVHSTVPNPIARDGQRRKEQAASQDNTEQVWPWTMVCSQTLV